MISYKCDKSANFVEENIMDEGVTEEVQKYLYGNFIFFIIHM
jgi:hypothetical protein